VSGLPQEDADSALWARLANHPLFADFSAEQRTALLRAAAEPDSGLRLRRFSAGEVIGRKGEYELTLCCVLGGVVDLLDPVPHRQPILVSSVGAGEFFGELGAMGGLPRTLDIVGREDGELFEISRYALKFVEVNALARARLAQRYRDRAVRATVSQMDLFAGVTPEAIDHLVPRCEIARYELRGLPLLLQGEAADALYIVRDGFVQVVREQPDGGKRVLAYLRAGDFFGEMALFDNGPRTASVLTAGKCELIKIGREDFLELCRRFPQVEAQARAVIARRREQEARLTPEISELLAKSGQLGVIQSDALLVMDLDLCVECDNCVRACEALHGKSRLVRNGIQLGKYLIPAACRHCDDPKCMNSCPTGTIQRRPEGEIYFEYEKCIGCGNCAIACPYDNIAMVDTPTFDHAQSLKAKTMKDPAFFRPYPVAAHDASEPGLWSRMLAAVGGRKPAPSQAPVPTHIPASFPIKCDLCDGLPFMGCVHNCPTGAAMRIDPAELFEGTGAVREGARVRKAWGGRD